jgi:hypothetical protein
VDSGNTISGFVIGIDDMTGKGCEINNTIDGGLIGIIHTTPLSLPTPQGQSSAAKKVTSGGAAILPRQ